MKTLLNPLYTLKRTFLNLACVYSNIQSKSLRGVPLVAKIRMIKSAYNGGGEMVLFGRLSRRVVQSGKPA